MRDGRLYWITDNFLRSVSTQGGEVNVLSSRAISNNVAPVVDVGFVYFPDTLLIVKVPIGGGPESDVMGGAVGVFAIDETRLFGAATGSQVYSRRR